MNRFPLLLLIILLAPSLGLAGENDLYNFLWLDPDKKVYVLQNKLYQKNKTFYVDLGYLSNLTSEFEDINGASVKAGFYFHEEWAVELQHNIYSSQTNTAFETVKDVNGLEPFTRRANSLTAAFLIWSPFYGKINTFNKIYYFDLSFGVGYGQMRAESNLDSVIRSDAKSTFESELYNPLLLKAALKFHVTPRFHIGVEFLNSNFQARSPKLSDGNVDRNETWKQFNDLTFSLGVSF
jgi:outer membrane beta-barrel protein